MASKRHSPVSIAAVMRRVETGITLEEGARKAGVHVNTILLWKKKYGQRAPKSSEPELPMDWPGPGLVDTMIGPLAWSGRMVIHGEARRKFPREYKLRQFAA